MGHPSIRKKTAASLRELQFSENKIGRRSLLKAFEGFLDSVEIRKVLGSWGLFGVLHHPILIHDKGGAGAGLSRFFDS